VGTLKRKELPEFKRINTALRSLKTTQYGAIYALRYHRYGHDLAAFA
jgi:hypothetical protein